MKNNSPLIASSTGIAGLTKQQLAKYLDRSTRTLDRLHENREGPPRIKMGSLVIYPIAGINNWIESEAAKQEAK